MKRSDLPTAIVLEAIEQHGVEAIDYLREEFPEKVILAAFRRDAAYLDYGVSERRPWLEPAGTRYLREMRSTDG